MKKYQVALVAICYLVFSTSLAFAAYENPKRPGYRPQPKSHIQTLKEKYYPRAANNEIYILPQDLYSSSFVYFIKEFRGGFQKGQRLIGNMGTDQQYFLYVIDNTDDTAIALLEEGNPNDIRRYDRLLIAVYDTPKYCQEIK